MGEGEKWEGVQISETKHTEPLTQEITRPQYIILKSLLGLKDSTQNNSISGLLNQKALLRDFQISFCCHFTAIDRVNYLVSESRLEVFRELGHEGHAAVYDLRRLAANSYGHLAKRISMDGCAK